ncbi:MAG TPA: hypothetical protein VFV58_29635 [Blastocatellia bacterium]|jgi:hypothetical protein|nr:hypothetical protein [Blastocatellia bacterium]
MTLNLRKMTPLFALIVALGFISTATAQKVKAPKDGSSSTEQKEKAPKAPKVGMPVIWSDPGEVEAMDFAGGIGGRASAPKPPFTFVEENMSGTNPKVRIIDANGVRWNAKFGSEVNAETFATRIAWAAGYYVEPDYFIPSGKIEKVGQLTRAKKFIQPDGSFTSARFEMHHDKGVKKLEDEQSWSWMENPFVGTKELNGLKVIMMLVSNWDNKDVRDISRGSNTAIFQTKTGIGLEDRYLITDWGGSMGKWGGYITREKWDCNGFHGQTKDFVKGVKGDQVEFGYSGQHTGSFKEGIRVSDVKWVAEYLGRIKDDQLRVGLQASGAKGEEVECFTKSLRERIDQLLKVAK